MAQRTMPGIWLAPLVCAAVLAQPAAGLSQPLPPALPLPSAADAASRLTANAWADRMMAPCREAAATDLAADALLRRQLAAPGLARDDARFLEREAVARGKAGAAARRAALSRLTTLLFAFKARLAVRGRHESLADLVTRLLGKVDACRIEAVERTLLVRAFGLPASMLLADRLDAEGAFAAVEAEFRALVEQGGDVTTAFARLRPAAGDDPVPDIEATLRAALAADASAPFDAEAFGSVMTLVPLVIEPLRVRFYLHGTVDALEGALGLTSSDAVDRHLFQLVEAQLFRSLDDMRTLRTQSPDRILARVAPLADEWFRHVVLPDVAHRLSRDPHAAFWFFVQSGGVVDLGRVFATSGVATSSPRFTLRALEGTTLAEAHARLAALVLPARYRAAFNRVEEAGRAFSLDPADVAAAITARQFGRRLDRRVRAVLLADEQSGRVTTLDAYTPLLRDASKTRGRLDRPAVRAALQVLSGEKARYLSATIDGLVRDDGGTDPAIEGYLRTATALLLERERRQGTEDLFQESSRGAAVGLVLRRFLGNALPVDLPVPAGVSGPEFGELVRSLAPLNKESGHRPIGAPVEQIAFVYDGREYHDALVSVINEARDFLNVSAFDWKTDTGGREVAYRLMAKKLGIEGRAFAAFEEHFASGVPLEPGAAPMALYDVPTTRIKDLLVWRAFMTSDAPDVRAAREAALAAGASLSCEAVHVCGSLEGLAADAGRRFDATDNRDGHARAWQAYARIDALFADRPSTPATVRPRRALADWVDATDALRRFVRRYGRRRDDRPAEPFPIAIVADGKQNVFNVRWGESSEQFPFVVTEPVRDIYFVLLEFDIRLVLWKAPIEFPWNVGPVPWPGRRMGGRLPMPFVPWPWLQSVPGFAWAGTLTSLALQWAIASDVRMWWASVNHTKSWSNESMALESGMGMASKYFNAFETHKTWHDMGVLVRGGVVDDVNDHFVQVFNEARVNNGGLSAARGTRIPRLRYPDYAPAATTVRRADGPQAWLLTTHPERGDASYRGVYVAALAAATTSIHIENSFFSDPLIAGVLMHKAQEFRARVDCEGLSPNVCAARRREAVQIYLVLPDSSDKPIVDAVGAADFFDMLNLGIRVHRWNPHRGWSASRMLHSKVWLIDYVPGQGGLAYVGAANATQRSHLSDNEAGILSNDPGFARDVYERLFVPDLTTASRRESGEAFRVIRASNPVVAGSRWLRRLLVELLWMI